MSSESALTPVAPWALLLVGSCIAAGAAACDPLVTVGSLPRSPEPPSAFDDGPIDVLLVIDSSNSMFEEKKRLATALYDSRCPIQSLVDVPELLRNPNAELLASLSQSCGIAQLLAAYDRDFRLGVITTDVNACDNFVPAVMGGPEAGFQPQRGCLQSVPSTKQRVLSRNDLNVPALLEETLLEGVRSWGSPFERSFDAVDAFLNGDTFSEACEGDRDLLLRDDAGLLIVFLSDEDDCSHADGAYGFSDESSDICGEDLSVIIEHSPGDCYARRELLAPVATYADRWRRLKGAGRERDVRVAVVGGAIPLDGADANGFQAAGCILGEGGQVTGACTEVQGTSSVNIELCGPGHGTVCCTADGAHRYAGLLRAFTDGDPRSGALRSICAPSYAGGLMQALHLGAHDDP